MKFCIQGDFVVSDQAFPVAAARSSYSDDLPQQVTLASSVPVLSARLKTFLFSMSFP